MKAAPAVASLGEFRREDTERLLALPIGRKSGKENLQDFRKGKQPSDLIARV
ncbi:hypothetical protein HPP92_019559 [Vanilla planifolia]|uniref:Uncharacterized protein n=1 Tax=Vanilla planifolia TaxID=51239 RepID=A0A835PZR4_VANPL|nr:hypothetical protein HPP92_019559 [Vanilla planifolia]